MFVSPARAALDPETTTPYRVQVVLHVAEHRLLTSVFKDQLARELRDGLQAGLGPMGSVEVVSTHPRLKDIEAKGLQAALDGAHELSDKKTLFVLIDFADDQYVIRTRQIDGLTGLASPVRQVRTSDRQFVARTAALLLDRDFGLVGTIEGGEPKGADVKVFLKGSALGVPLGRWVHKGEVFAIVQVHKTGTKATRVPWALLVATADPKPGETTLTCRLYQRYRLSLVGGASIAGHRCLKLGTIDAPLHLRLIDDKTLRPIAQSISIRRHGFEGNPEESPAADVDGYLVSKKPYAHVAFVTVHSGEAVRARMPIEIIDDRPIVVPISVDAKAELIGQLELQRRQWVGQLHENLLVVDALFKQLNEHVDKKNHAGALKDAQAGLARLKVELAARSDDMRGLRDQGVALDLSEGEQRLQELTVRRDELQKFVTNLDQVIKQAKDPRRVEILAMVEQAQLLEREAEFARAISVYRKIVDGAAEHPAVREDASKQLTRLEKQWAVKGDDHAKARKFIYETWPKLESVLQLKDWIDEAGRAFQVCQTRGDVLTPRMLLKANLVHATKLTKRLEALGRADNEDDRREAETIAAVGEQLDKLTKQVTGFLRK